MAIRAIVVDDSTAARERILELSESVPDLRIVDECSSGSEAVASVRALAPEVIFLEIDLPDRRGFDVLTELEGDHSPVVVFVTGQQDHALEAFRVNAADYLLKPLDTGEFQRAMARVRERTRKAPAPVQGAAPPSRPPHTAAPLRRLKVQQKRRSFFVPTEDVVWLTADQRYVRIGTVSGDEHRLRETLSELEERLDPRQFLRIHRATLVNLDHIREVRRAPGSKYSVVTDDGRVHAVSRAGRRALRRHH